MPPPPALWAFPELERANSKHRGCKQRLVVALKKKKKTQSKKLVGSGSESRWGMGTP